MRERSDSAFFSCRASFWPRLPPWLCWRERSCFCWSNCGLPVISASKLHLEENAKPSISFSEARRRNPQPDTAIESWHPTGWENVMGRALYRVIPHQGGCGVEHNGSIAGPYASKEAALEAAL